MAVDLATHADADGLIVESTFTSIRTLVRRIYHIPLPELPVKYDSLSKIGQVKMPLLAIHGTRDELIPLPTGGPFSMQPRSQRPGIRYRQRATTIPM